MNKATVMTVLTGLILYAGVFANTQQTAASGITASAVITATAPIANTNTAAVKPNTITGSATALTATAALSVTTAAAPNAISGSAAAMALTTTGALSLTASAKADIGEYINITFAANELNKITLWWWNKMTQTMPSMATGSATALTATAALSVTTVAAPNAVSGSAAAAAQTTTAALSVTTAAAPNAISGSAAAMALTTTGALSLTSGAKPEEQFYYNVYRKIAKQDYLKINKELISEEKYVDAEINTSTIYYYKIQIIDSAGKTHMSKAFSVKSLDLVYPGEPQDFKAFQDIESTQLKWSTAMKGTDETSGYNIYRGNTTTAMKFVAFVPGAKTQYTDIGLKPGVKYYYTVRAIDISKRESKDSDYASAVAFPPPRTGLILAPTALRNDINSNYGLNVDCMFSYYIGQIFGQHGNIEQNNIIVANKGTDSIGKLGVWLLTVDAKWCLFNEWEAIPSIAAGYMYTMLLQDQIGAPVSSNTTQVEQSISLSGHGQKAAFTSLSSIYLAVSKKLFWETTFHAGYIMGTQDEFLPYLSQYLSTSDESNKAYFFGISRPIFARMGLRVEFTGMLNAPLSPWLVNVHIDRLSSFDLAYFHFDGGYSILGYLSFRFTVFPTPYR